VLIADAVIGFVRVARGVDDSAVGRRLSQTASAGGQGLQQINLIRPQRDAGHPLKNYLPFYDALVRLFLQSGSSLTIKTAAIVSASVSVVAAVLFAILMPLNLLLFAVPFGLVIGIAPILLYLMRARTVRVANFEEQFPDAIDLIVRSLRVGHPLSAAISVIAREMPAPINAEFSLANDKVSYGLTIPDAFREMAERVPLADLGYLIAAVQIHEEAGGNLVESLSKLAGVIRERFRMFRKVKAITAEGRLSAWLLSFFPLLAGFGVQLVKPDYFSSVADYPYFPYLVAGTAVMLVINIIVMLKITKIRV
jgi:tight adherence protein B